MTNLAPNFLALEVLEILPSTSHIRESADERTQVHTLRTSLLILDTFATPNDTEE